MFGERSHPPDARRLKPGWGQRLSRDGHGRTRTRAGWVDTPWALASFYGAVLASSLPLQQRIWSVLAMDSSARLLTVLAPLIALSTLMLASALGGAWLAPRTSEALAD